MSFIELPGFGAVSEPKVAPEGMYNLIVEQAKTKTKEDSGKTSIMVILSFDGQPEYANFFHYLSLPGADDDKDSAEFKMLMIRRFFAAFNVPYDENGFDLENLFGAQGANLRVIQEEYEGNLGNKLQLPRISE